MIFVSRLFRLLTFLLCALSVISIESPSQEPKDVALREALILISTLDGSLHAVSQRSGIVKWSITDEPILTLVNKNNHSEETKHLLLPDPKDGSLYVFNGFNNGKKHKTLEKLPFTISELVGVSPCHSSDGMLYTTKKHDEWVVVDTATGEKLDMVTEKPVCETKQDTEEAIPKAFDSAKVKFETPSSNLLHLFKTQYEVSVFNSMTREKLFNLTFNDFSPSIVASVAPNSYDYIHLTSSANGKMVTIDKSSDEKNFLWSHQFSSPIVSIFKVSDNSQFPTLQRLPFLTLGGFINVTTFFEQNSLQPSVYIGEMSHSKSLYALSALVEFNEMRKDSNYLIEGPDKLDLNNVNMPPIGHYDFPKLTDISFWQIKKSQLIPSVIDYASKLATFTAEDKVGDNKSEKILDRLENYTTTLHNLVFAVAVLFAVTLVVIGAVAYHAIFGKRNEAINVGKHKNGNVKIGKISYNKSDIIGRGCAGTCVYKGMFEGRQEIAVKRIVNDCFKIANREIEMLRKLQHPHLIRYFATENDEQFLHIALELAEMTLAEYIDRKYSDQEFEFGLNFEHAQVLHQACLGLAHLHSLDIVHRDIKPQNILISLPLTPNKTRKIMISDFGVSKVLNTEHSLTTDFSAGTEGWIAPEILKAKLHGRSEKASKPNDIFSMGCLIFYAFSGGDHPFGNLLHRQSNIISGLSDLNQVQKEESMSLWSLVDSMINLEPSARPTIEAVLKHPLFWNSKQSLQFLQDISDRMECEKSVDSPIVSSLEYGGIDVCQGDWRRHISIELQEDLRKFRNYKGSSVRDLLRAIRNKRHHYHELAPELQNSLGSIPDKFVNYFTSKFPRLIPHSYVSLQSLKREDIFHSYYHVQDELTTVESDDFKFRILPKSGVAWYAKLKDEGKPKDFAFDRRNMKKINQNQTSVTSTTTTAAAGSVMSDEPPPLPSSAMNWKSPHVQQSQQTSRSPASTPAKALSNGDSSFSSSVNDENWRSTMNSVEHVKAE